MPYAQPCNLNSSSIVALYQPRLISSYLCMGEKSLNPVRGGALVRAHQASTGLNCFQKHFCDVTQVVQYLEECGYSIASHTLPYLKQKQQLQGYVVLCGVNHVPVLEPVQQTVNGSAAQQCKMNSFNSCIQQTYYFLICTCTRASYNSSPVRKPLCSKLCQQNLPSLSLASLMTLFEFTCTVYMCVCSWEGYYPCSKMKQGGRQNGNTDQGESGSEYNNQITTHIQYQESTTQSCYEEVIAQIY